MNLKGELKIKPTISLILIAAIALTNYQITEITTVATNEVVNEITIEEEVDKKAENPNAGRIYVTVGDSITARDRQQYNEKEPFIGFQQTLNKKLEYDNYVNIGISGSTIARGTPYLRGLSKLCDAMYFGNNVDFILIGAGTNDFGQSTPLGTKAELTKENPDAYTFYGGYAKLVKDIKRNNPDAEIYLWTPLQRAGNYPSERINDVGLTLKDYSDATKEVAKALNVNLIDVFNSKKITRGNISKYTDAGLHPTNEGYEILGEILAEEIKAKTQIKTK